MHASHGLRDVPADPSAPLTTPGAGHIPPVWQQPIAPALYELALSPSQRALFAASAGGLGPSAPPSKLFRLAPDTLAVQHIIDLPFAGFGLALDDAAGRLYVGHTMDAAVSVVDIATNTVSGTLRLEEKVWKDGKEVYPHHLRKLLVDPVNTRLYVPGLSFEDSVLFVIDTHTFTLQARLDDLGFLPSGLALDEEGRRLFVSNMEGRVLNVDTNALAVSHRLETGADQPLNLAFDSATRRLFMTDQGVEMMRGFQAQFVPGFASRHPGNRVLVLHADDGRQLASLPTGEGPVSVLFDSVHRRLWASNRAAGTVTAYDSDTYALLDTITLGDHPNSLTLDPRDGTVFASVKRAEQGVMERIARISF